MTRHVRLIVAAVCISVLTAALAHAQESVARIEISGTSTVRGWTCPVDGAMAAAAGGGSAALPGLPNGIGPVTIRVQVREIECPEEQMKEHLQEAMNASQHPEIVYELQQYTVTEDNAAATGTITIHGVTQPISLDIELVDSPEGRRGVGQTEIDMTAFGVTPPSLWGGLMNVGEMVQIQFDAPMPSAR